ncbi:unnamed protein product, partial [Staurois parvus]
LLSCWGLCLCICGLCAYFGRLLRWPFLGRCVLGSSLVRPNRFLGGYWWMRSGAPVNGWRCWYVGLRRTNWDVVVGCVFFRSSGFAGVPSAGDSGIFVVQWGRGVFPGMLSKSWCEMSSWTFFSCGGLIRGWWWCGPTLLPVPLDVGCGRWRGSTRLGSRLTERWGVSLVTMGGWWSGTWSWRWILGGISGAMGCI